MAKNTARARKLARRAERAAKTLEPAAPAAHAKGATIVQRYDAAGSGRRLRGWIAPASGPNRAINGSAATLRNRSRDAARNEWSAKAAQNRWRVNLIGTGIVPRPRAVTPEQKAAYVKLWDDWCAVSDADGVLDFYGQQAMVANGVEESGEVFVRLRPRRTTDGLPVPLQIQVIEADQCPIQDFRAPNGNEVLSGIEFNALGKRVAYWLTRGHPGDSTTGSGLDTVRVPAETVLHIYEPTRPGQLRGVPQSAPILAKLRGIGNFDDAVMHRQEISNLFTAFITSPPGGPAATDPLTGQPIKLTDDGMPMAPMEPGTSQCLLPGEDVKFSEPPGPGADYDDYMRIQSQHLAAGQGLPAELLTGDLRDISDRTLRVMINEFRRHCEQRQWLCYIPMLCQPVRKAWANAAWMAGLVDDPDSAASVLWVPQGWAYIHPTQDAEAEKLQVDNGFRSRSQIITRRGDDPETIDAERAEDAAREKRLNLTPAER